MNNNFTSKIKGILSPSSQRETEAETEAETDTETNEHITPPDSRPSFLDESRYKPRGHGLIDGTERDEWDISEPNTVFFEMNEDLFMFVHDSVTVIEGSANTINFTEYGEPAETYTARLTDSDVAERALVVESNGQAHIVNYRLYRELCEQVGVDWEDAELLIADMYGSHPVGVRVAEEWTLYIAPIINVGIESVSKERL